MDEDDQVLTARPRRGRQIALAVVLLLFVALLALWTQRKPIASDFIDRELAARGVPARYQITRLGFRTQRVEKVSIGDVSNPDLTADWAELDIAVGLGGPEVRAIRAHGVRLRGRLVDGVVHMGAVDRLLPPPSGKPFSLPDIAVALDDARMRLETPVGPLSLRLDGTGGLASGFAGRLLASASPAVAGCNASELKAALAIRITNRKPHLAGPVRARDLACGGVMLAAPRVVLDATLDEALDRWTGRAAVASGGAAGPMFRLSGLAGRIGFAGTARQTTGTVHLDAAGPQSDAFEAGSVGIEGRYAIGKGAPDRFADDPIAPAGLRYSFDGSASAARAILPATVATRVGGMARSLGGTPLGPVLEEIGGALARNGRRIDARAVIAVAGTGQGGSVRVETLSADGADGARLRFAGGEGIRIAWPGATRAQIDGRLALTGGGFPATVVDVGQQGIGAPISGVARIEPLKTRDARLALAPVRFATVAAGVRFETVLTADGPLPGGRVTGLVVPISGNIGRKVLINPACVPLFFRSLAMSGLVLDPAGLRLCPVGGAMYASAGGRIGGGARIAAPALSGRLGTSPITLAAAAVEVGAARGGFTVGDLAIRLGPANKVSRLDIARLDGASGVGGLAGRFSGGAGKIANVPVLVSEAGGDWTLRGGILTLSGGVRVADEANPPRFNPLRSTDFALRIAGDALTAGGTLSEPARGTAVTRVAITHSLKRGIGHASLDIPGLTFGKTLQPEALTSLTLGVVANVFGTVSGHGDIRWTPEVVTSDGAFSTQDMSLAAAFGPVTGLGGTIRFSDLLGLQTPPGQELRLGTVNPGIAVEDGVIRYQLLPDQRVAIEDGHWPLAGGSLVLRPTTVAFGQAADRRLTFDVTGLDAAKFINKLELENLSATGTFDGSLPMIFDANGGRIVGGTLVARAPGGTLAYVGEVSNANLGIWGGIAFDALKAIAYQNLTIDFNGAIDGEMVSQVKFLGVSRGTVRPIATGLLATIGGRLASKLQALPFRFNIRIAAPFRGLVATTRSFYDPSILVRDSLPPGAEPVPQPVQPPDSEDKR